MGMGDKREKVLFCNPCVIPSTVECKIIAFLFKNIHFYSFGDWFNDYEELSEKNSKIMT